MKHTSLHIGIGLMVAVAVASPLRAHGAKLQRTSDRPACVDGIETEPFTDEAQPILVAADGCTVEQTVISI